MKTETLSIDQIERLAEMIADGRSEMPTELQPADLERVEEATRRHLRDRLFRIIVRALAQGGSVTKTTTPKRGSHA
jgi:hypothetical protein